MKKKDALTQTISNGGNLSLNHLRLSHCSPAAIDTLSAMYEHKVFSQAVIWNINPFDQPGVDGVKNRF